MAVAHYLAPIVVFICASTPSPSQGAEDVPSIFNLSEVSNDGRIIHNRVTFDCTPESRHSVSCLLIQQDIREPTPPSKDEIDKMIAQLGDPLDMCKQLTAPLGRGEPNHERLFMERARNACAKKDRTELVAAFRDRIECPPVASRGSILSTFRGGRLGRINSSGRWFPETACGSTGG